MKRGKWWEKFAFIGGVAALAALVSWIAFFTDREPVAVLNFVSPLNLAPTTSETMRPAADVRPAAVAGSFYPADAGALRTAVQGYLAAADPPKFADPVRLVIVPHAGYEYSGATAAFAFKPLIGSGYSRAVIIGRSHNAVFSGVKADGHDAWDTPLGRVAVDRDFIQTLAQASGVVSVDSAPHDAEHSLEVEVPFVASVLGPDVRIVPLLFGDEDRDAAAKLGAALAEVADARTVVIVSSDLSHYPSPDDADFFDHRTIDAVMTDDPSRFHDLQDATMKIAAGKVATLACASIAIESGLAYARAAGLTPHFLNYANSGTGRAEANQTVVGYGALAFTGPLPEAPGPLDAAAREEALGIARSTLDAYFQGQDYRPSPRSTALAEKRGVFVTLYKDGELRGCVGVFAPDKTLAESIKDMALSAAFEDQRFPPLRQDEWPAVQVEISALSPLARVNGPADIVLGRDGVYLTQGQHAGVFLPQVATESGWDKNRFLSELCAQKAGLPADCWQDPRTEFYSFTAQVFE